MNQTTPLNHIPPLALLKILEGQSIQQVATEFGIAPHLLQSYFVKRCSQICTQFISHPQLPFNDLIQALDNINLYIFLKDINGRYTYVNHLVCQFLGINLQDIINHTDSDFFSGTTLEAIYQHDYLVLKQGQTIQVEETLKLSTGTHIFLTTKIPLYNEQGQICGLCGMATDITERKHTENALRRNQELLSTVVDNMGACVYMKSPDGRYLYANNAMADLVHQHPAQLIGKKDADFFTQEVSQQLTNNDAQVFAQQQRLEILERFQLLHDTQPRYYWSVKVPLQGNNHQTYAVLGISSDMTERKRLEDQLTQLATTDELTGLHNRRHFLQRAEQNLTRSRRYSEPFTLLMCDIDFFKHINDTFGHATGDNVLQHVSKIIQTSIRDSDIAGRIGGEEFAIILVQTPLAQRGYEVAERLRLAIESAKILTEDGQEVPLTMSIGAVEPIYPHDTLPTLMQRADQLLYQAKRTGRNKVC